MGTANANYNLLLTTTLNKYRDQLADNVTSNTFLVWWLKEKGRIEPVDGGVKILEPLMYGKGTAKSYNPSDVLDAPVVDGVSAAEFNWKYVYTPIVMPIADQLKNKGSAQIINILNAKIEQAEITMSEDMNDMLWGDGLGNGGLDFLGLQAIISILPTSGTLGGINRATDAFWRNQYAAGTKTTTDYDNLLKVMRNMFISTKMGKNKKDCAICTTPTVFSGYEGLLQPLMRFMDESTADGGFDNLLFKGVPLTYDDDTPTGCMYFLNSRFLKLRPHTDENFTTTDFVTPPNQRVSLAYILLMGNLTVSNCARLGVLYSIT